MASIKPLIVITGPTASGKSGLALKLAERYHGEIICADSRTVYAGLNIGTAKPSDEEQLRIPHHLLDVVAPDERFTVADFQRLTKIAIADIRARGKVPFLVGGTGLYIDSVVLDYELGSEYDADKRKLLEEKSVEELVTLLEKLQLDKPNNMLNKRHLVRALEQKKVNSTRKSTPDANVHVVSIATDSDVLMRRVKDRANEMFASGVVEEARQLAELYDWNAEALSGNIYPILRRVIDGEISEDEAKELFIIRDRQLIKRQLTWLKRHKFVNWLSLEEAEYEISRLLDRTA